MGIRVTLKIWILFCLYQHCEHHNKDSNHPSHNIHLWIWEKRQMTLVNTTSSSSIYVKTRKKVLKVTQLSNKWQQTRSREHVIYKSLMKTITTKDLMFLMLKIYLKVKTVFKKRFWIKPLNIQKKFTNPVAKNKKLTTNIR